MQSKTAKPPTEEQTNEIKQYAAFFDLLNQIDQRLKKEDSEYRNKYYPEKGNENNRNSDHTS